ncbi:hypothetical protein OJAV_G00009390 [Oryzias javanicus]|uniref:Protein MGARP N-terminal domain-containing protein n=1 Tax=Oryzias javanicus TaxID=123683 RepID=A0A437DMU5_ORYJA|nr:hypothetical protein OJAV_G00009390 [Oryzias javanicus]
MFCRRAWQRLAPLAQRVFKPAFMNAPPVRRMAFGVPGGSTNVAYFVLCGGGLTAAVVYAYKTVNDDSERYEDRLANMSSKTALSSEAVPEESVPAAEPASVESAPAAELASEESAPAAELASEESAPAAEPASVESAPAAEPAPAEEETEVAPVAESVPAASEPVAEISADPVTEASPEEAAAPAEEEVALDASAAEMSEAPAAESTDLLVEPAKSFTAEIAAASVGEESSVKAVPHAEVDRTGLNAEMETFLEASEEEPHPASEVDLKAANDAEDEGAAEEKVTTAATTTEDKESSEEIHLIEEPENILPSTEAPPEDAALSEEASPVEELTEDPTVGEQTMPEEITAVDPEAVFTPEPEAECCPTCHSAPSTGEEELRPPADAPAEDLVPEVEENTTVEAKEESSSLVEEQTTNSLAVLTAGL